MNNVNTPARALFISPDGKIYPDNLICSGMISGELNGKPCPYAQNGRLPDLIPLDETHSSYSIDKGKPGDLCPACAKQPDGGTSHLKALRINGYKIKERKRWVIDSTKHPYPPYVSKRISQSVRK
jgi:hypothetical protein